jgi:hypothetical protein
MSADATNAVLKLVALLNDGPNHACTYELIELPQRREIVESLESTFGPGEHWSTKKPYSAGDWHLRVEPRGTDIRATLTEVLKTWIFAMPYSPALGSARDWVKGEVVEVFCQALTDTIGPCEICEVFVSPPVWYEAHWQDFAFRGKDKSWLLRLGVSD